MSMAILRMVWRCLVVSAWNRSHSDLCMSLNATAKWWFSSTDSSLYISANSEPWMGGKRRLMRRDVLISKLFKAERSQMKAPRDVRGILLVPILARP